MKLNRNGSTNTALILIIAIAFLFLSLVFGIWAFSGMQKYKNNADQLVQNAVAKAQTSQQATDARAAALAAENPLTSYSGPEAYGSILVHYPKNWSSYVDTSNTSANPVDGYFYPGTLPAVSDSQPTNFALRIQVISQSYTQTLGTYQGLEQSGQASSKVYSLPKVPSVVGVEITGQLVNSKTGTLVILPLRNESLLIWTEGNEFLNDFNNNILPNFSFSP